MSQTKAQLVSGTTAQDLTVDNINTTSINSGQVSGRKNLIINGDMQVAQRGTSSGSSGYKTVDRFQFQGAGLNASVTTEQANVASGTTPYTLGFRKSYKITNGAQTGPDASDKIEFITKIEAGEIAKSGWNYKSASSDITLSFWVKSSVAQNFFGYIITLDGTSQNFPFETGSLTADTWTKITKTIPGNSNLDFDSDATGGINEGLRIVFQPFMGTSNTGSVSLNAWAAFNSSVRTPNQTSTWFTTNGATWEFTGVQLEVGSTATDFEHRSFAEELKLCQRYFQSISRSSSTNSVDGTFAAGTCNNNAGNGGILQTMVRFQTTMRAAPTMTDSGTFSFHVSGVNVADTSTVYNKAFVDGVKITATQTAFVVTSGFCGELTSKYSDTSTATINADAEL
jgi:hypothetical protein